jgi:hypothetical protein
MPQHRHIYCLSGLGADFRIFSKLKLDDVTLHPIQWEMPAPGDTLPVFAKKLAGQIQHENPVLLGVSFGGMLATEMSRIIPVQKTIIISSCKRRSELPAYMRAAGRIGIHKAIPYWLVTQHKKLNRFIFDARSHEEELYLKQMMLTDTSVEFIKRSVNMILQWQNDVCPSCLVHVHGNRDKLLLPGSVSADYWVKEGGHFMIWNMANEISGIIQKELQALEG